MWRSLVVSGVGRLLCPLIWAATLWPVTGWSQVTQEEVPAEAREAQYWLSRIHAATKKRSFFGTFVVSTGASIASARIEHYCDGTNQFERIEPLDGHRRQVLRHNDLVTSLWPQQQVALIETRQSMSQFPALLSAGVGRIVDRYRVRPLGEGRVAGHEAHVLLLSPKDGFRFGYRLWAEKDSGLLLRAEVLDEREGVLEASAFSDVTIGVKPRPEQVLKAMKGLEGWRIERTVLEPTDLQSEGWELHALPPGFLLVSTVRRSMATDAAAPPGVLQSIYSDGLTHVSIFIEPFVSTLHQRETMTSVGATQTMTHRLGEWWITVIGDVPAATLRGFVLGLERRP